MVGMGFIPERLLMIMMMNNHTRVLNSLVINLLPDFSRQLFNLLLSNILPKNALLTWVCKASALE